MSTAVRWLSAVALLALLGALCAPGAPAQPSELERKVQRITEQLRCPTCQAVSVRDSEASFSRQIRSKVERMVEEGQSEEDIKAYFVSRYGEWILRAPKKEGLGLVLWLLPGAAVLLGGGLLGLHLYRTARRKAAAGASGSAAAQAPPLSEEQRRRVEADLARFEEQD